MGGNTEVPRTLVGYGGFHLQPVSSPVSAQDSPGMTPEDGPERTRADRKPTAAPRSPETVDDLRKPCYGRLRAMTIRWTWFVPS